MQFGLERLDLPPLLDRGPGKPRFEQGRHRFDDLLPRGAGAGRRGPPQQHVGEAPGLLVLDGEEHFGFRGAIRHIGGHDIRPGIVVKTGTSDMNVVAPVWRCPILAYGAGDSSLDHTPSEHVVLEEWWKAVLVVEEALRRWAEAPDGGGGS